MTLRNAVLLPLCLCALAAQAQTADNDDGYNEVTIRPGDIPRGAPRFAQFAAPPFKGKNARPILNGDPETKMYRTRIRQWSLEKPNFAGHFILATWGCGTDCVQFAVIDAATGKVFHPAGLSTNVSTNVHADLLDEGGPFHQDGSLKFRADSKLLILIGMPNEDKKRRGISYYTWNGTQLALIRFVPKAWYADEK